jgi:heme oxygenase (biliverdin-IX-beta and delta-forming)
MIAAGRTAPAAPGADAFLKALRERTADAHKQLEQMPGSVSITDPAVTKQEYGSYLSRMLQVMHATEQEIFPLLHGIIPDLSERKKSQLAAADLGFIGHRTQCSNFQFSGGTKFSVPFALGILYVIEGSTLGGRIILKNISAALQLDENHGASYFAGYGAQTGVRWKTFIDAMVSYEAEHNCGDEIIAGARFGFEMIIRLFQNH